MNNTTLFVNGAIIGFLLAAPVGPVGVLCAQRSLTHGRIAGLISGLGAATADTFFGLVAAFGLSVISDFIMEHQDWVRCVGGAALIGLSIKLVVSAPARAAQSNGTTDHLGNFFSTFALTITNPITIMSFAFVFASFGVMSAVVTAIDAWILVGGVFAGSITWWLIITLGVGLFRGILSDRGMRWISRISAVIIFAFGVIALLSVILGEDILALKTH